MPASSDTSGEGLAKSRRIELVEQQTYSLVSALVPLHVKNVADPTSQQIPRSTAPPCLHLVRWNVNPITTQVPGAFCFVCFAFVLGRRCTLVWMHEVDDPAVVGVFQFAVDDVSVVRGARPALDADGGAAPCLLVVTAMLKGS